MFLICHIELKVIWALLLFGFFNKFSNLPMFYQALVVGAFSTILGIKGVSTFKKK